MPSHLWAVFTSVVIVASAAPAASAGEDEKDAVAESSTGALRTDHLTPKERKKWKKVEAIVMAEDVDGRPLHPTLRELWETVDSSTHVVRVELVRTKKSAIAGRFEVTRVDPRGLAHQARLILNLRALDRVSTKPAAARANGFIPFKGLDEAQKHAELVAHELAHAAWHLQSVERARIAERIHREKEELARRLLAAGSQEERVALLDEARSRDRYGRALEEDAEALEAEVWKELVEAQQRM